MAKNIDTHQQKLQWHTASAAPEVLRQWQLLESQTDLPLPATAAWVESWLSVYGELVPHRFVSASIGGITQAVCLVTDSVQMREGPLRIKSVHLGTAGEPEADSAVVEYNSVAAAPDLRQWFMQQVIEALQQESSHDEIRLDGFSTSDLDWLPKEQWKVNEMVSPYFDLAAARRENSQDLVAFFGTKTRRNLRQNFRAYGDLTVQWSEGVEQTQQFFEEMVDLHQKRWIAQGEPGSYASSYFLKFNQALIKRLAPAGKTAIIRVSNGDGVLGSSHVLIDRQRVLKYQAGIAAYTNSRESPGLVTDFMAIDAAYQKGFDAYDFLCGALQSKLKLSTSQTHIVWAQLRKPRLKFRALDKLRGLRQSLRKSDAVA